MITLKEDFKDCNESLDMLCKKLMREFLTSQHNEYNSTDSKQKPEKFDEIM